MRSPTTGMKRRSSAIRIAAWWSGTLLGLALFGFVLSGLMPGDHSVYAKQKGTAGGMTPLPSDLRRPSRYIPGEVLVKFKGEASPLGINSVTDDGGTQEIKAFSVRGSVIHQYKLDGTLSVDEAVAKYRNNPAVEYAEPNYLYWATTIPSDAKFETQWGLHNTGQPVNGTAGTPDADIDAPEAWDISTGSSDVVIAVIDSGIAYDHPDLAPNIWTNPREIAENGVDDDGNGFVDDVHGWDFLMNDSDPMDPIDLNPGGNPGHGTHVAGIIAGAGNNGTGVTGVMWAARLMALKAGGVNGALSTAAIVSAIHYGIANGARVINASFSAHDCSQALYDAVNAANAAGVILVAAAGNEAADNDNLPSFPANFASPSTCDGQQKAALPNVIAVAATDENDQLISLSNFGSTTVHVAAPGIRINSTKPTSSVTNVLLHKFDSNPTALGYTFGGINNTWGFTNTASFSQSNSLTDSPSGNYQNSTDSFATGPLFTTEGQRGCRLDSRIRLHTEQDIDGVLTEASRDGGTSWEPIRVITGNTNDQFEPFTLGEIADDMANSRFRFRFESDEREAFDGVYLDDVRVVCVSSQPSEATDYQFLLGTSMATPHVTGLVGLLLSVNPNLTVSELRNAILNTVDRKPALSGKVSTGGRINARAALASVVATFSITVNKSGAGGGTILSSTAGIDCGTTCTGQFPQGITVNLTAAPDSQSVFAGWSGDCTGTGPCSLTDNAAVTATFNLAPTPSAPVEREGGGCTLAPGSAGDMLLPTLLLMSVVLVLWRTHRR
uniref:S8 family serine peptidase n=1 Tax=Nitrospira cf. moscoviensis SBR1015 TaxID=96242 RepID=UPI000A39F866|nr:S8 family serine peptidase [Nitrospira cf. moscoviensis SBR1015]